MAQPISLSEQLTQLEAARHLVLSDAALYPQVIQGILPIIGPQARLELRRWGAEFLAETFASPVFPSPQKESLVETVLPTLRDLLDDPAQDPAVVKSVVQTAASIYPLVFRHVINHPDATSLWQQMTTIKQSILQRMDTSPHPVRVCCIKFVQRVVHVQTPAGIADPRRPEKNETSIALVPRGHALLQLPALEAEASGLLDRLLTILQDNSDDAVLVNATLNCLSVLARTRSSVFNRIVETILDFNPLASINGSLTPAMRVKIKSMERTARAVLIYLVKRSPNHPLAGKMQQRIERLSQSRLDILEENSRKRGMPPEPTDGVDNAKRAKLGVEAPVVLKIPPLPPGPTSYAQLFTLTEDAGLASFDVKQLPADMVVRIVVPLLERVNQDLLNQAVEGVRGRYQTLMAEQARKATQPAQEEDDDYEPEYEPADITMPDSQLATTGESQPEPDLALGPFVLPQPPPLSEDEAREIGQNAVERVFGMAVSMPGKSTNKLLQPKLGFARLAGSTFDRDAWVTMLTRLASRASAGLDSYEQQQRQTIADSIREMLYRYILEDFRPRINVGISWMNEEWYNDRVQLKFAAQRRKENPDQNGDDVGVPLHYDRWVIRLLDGILPYLDARDKVLIRFVSEIPEITREIVARVQGLARDPERVGLCVQALLYLVMFRPPAREMCLDALEEVYRSYEAARPSVEKILTKWRPQALSAVNGGS
ncbi:hypothetical protein VTN49DRAFT_6126 [Thermomyces lanuginosus]|uniref:uncharacterized protein n=1 Tax=Thermomyces lanuginosus TaxID=5541 RepID=UPI003742BC10